MPVEYSDLGLEYLHEAGDYNTVFVLDNFNGDVFHRLHRAGARIMGPPVIIKSAMHDEVIHIFLFSTLSYWKNTVQENVNKEHCIRVRLLIIFINCNLVYEISKKLCLDFNYLFF